MSFSVFDHGMASTGTVDSPYQHQLNGRNLSTTNNRSRLIPCKLTCVNVCSAYPRNAFLIGDLSQTKGDGFRHLVRSQVVPVAARLGLYSVVKTAVYTRVSSTAVCKTIVVSEKSSFRPASLPMLMPLQEVRHNPCRGTLGAQRRVSWRSAREWTALVVLLADVTGHGARAYVAIPDHSHCARSHTTAVQSPGLPPHLLGVEPHARSSPPSIRA